MPMKKVELAPEWYSNALNKMLIREDAVSAISRKPTWKTPLERVVFGYIKKQKLPMESQILLSELEEHALDLHYAGVGRIRGGDVNLETAKKILENHRLFAAIYAKPKSRQGILDRVDAAMKALDNGTLAPSRAIRGYVYDDMVRVCDAARRAILGKSYAPYVRFRETALDTAASVPVVRR
ncbi:Uncharacterised protein [Candidatus Norongarragalina meridionalis]|nr:Uncharacterised protein [Candidatus Norongarragalina meridionalis]